MKIVNKQGDVAVINHILKFFVDGLVQPEPKMELPKNYRVFNFINDDPNSLDKKVVDKFGVLFETYGLNCRRYKDGKVFPIDSIPSEIKIEDDLLLGPRYGQDGGVVGVCN